MGLQARKLDIIEWLLHLQDANVLKQIEILRKSEADWWDEISERERKAIDEGLDEIVKGKVVTHTEVMRKVKRRFGI